MSGDPTEVPTLVGGPGLQTTLGAEDGRTARAEPETPIRPGDVLGERYRIVERIGAGGMGTVYRAEHIAIQKPVAIKVLGQEFTVRERLVERFMQEARAASRIRHEHIVDITDFGYVRDGVPFFAMEYLEGQTLAERIAERGRLPWPQARRIVAQICTALEAAHRQGVVHRDMKPDNVFLVERSGRSDFVKVLDFGIAKLVTEEADRSLTQTGAVIGTAAYMSPEQAQSLPVDPRTDVYSTGVILYQMLTGRIPFDADGFLGVLAKHLTERPPSMRSVAPDAKIPAAVERVVQKALRKQREERYASAEQLAEALLAIDEDAGAGSRRWVVLALGLTAALGLTWSLVSTGDHEPPSDPPPTPADARDPGSVGGGEPRASPETAPAPVPARTGTDTGTDSEAGTLGATSDPTSAEALPAGGTSPAGGPSPEDETAVDPTTGAPDPGSEPDPVEPPPTSRPRRPRRPRPVPDHVSPKDIERALGRVRVRFDACAEKYAGRVPVRVKVTFRIAESGEVTTASAQPPNHGLPLGRCFENVVRSIRFPRARQPTEQTRELMGKSRRAP